MTNITTITTLTTLTVLTAISSAAFAASGSTATWQDEVLVAMAEADPNGDWQLVPVKPWASDPEAEADIVIERYDDDSTSVQYYGDVTLEWGIIAAMSADGHQALILPHDILVCDREFGCEVILPDKSAFYGADFENCTYPICGVDVDVLARASPVYLVANVVEGDDDNDGVQTYKVIDIIVSVDKIEPEEID